MNLFEELKGMAEVCCRVSEALSGVHDRILLMSILGTVVDEWSVNNGLTKAESLSIFDDLAEVQKQVVEVLGVFPERMAK